MIARSVPRATTTAAFALLVAACVIARPGAARAQESGGPGEEPYVLPPAPAPAPVRMIFDTDVGNDIDDALALAVIHELADRGVVDLLAVAVCKSNVWSAVYTDVVNAFYGRPDVPIGLVRDGPTPEDGKFVRQVSELRNEAGDPLFPRSLSPESEIPEATALVRKTLAAQPDGSVVYVSVGFLTIPARLLASGPDEHSPLTGEELVRAKIRLYVMMAGAFSPERRPEYNVHVDAHSSRVVFERWPTPIVASGYEIGEAIRYPAASVERDFAWTPRSPVVEAYVRYMKMPYDRQAWDLTAVLYAAHPDRGYFDLGHPGRIWLGEMAVTLFGESSNGSHRYLIASPEQIARVREALVQLASSPPGR